MENLGSDVGSSEYNRQITLNSIASLRVIFSVGEDSCILITCHISEENSNPIETWLIEAIPNQNCKGGKLWRQTLVMEEVGKQASAMENDCCTIEHNKLKIHWNYFETKICCKLRSLTSGVHIKKKCSNLWKKIENICCIIENDWNSIVWNNFHSRIRDQDNWK